MRVEPFFLANGIAILLTSACTQQLPRDFQFPSYEAVKAAPVSLFDAIALVEKSKGGHAISVEIEVENGVTGYEIETLNDATLHEYVVDPNTGGIRPNPDTDDLARSGFYDGDSCLPELFSRASISLTQAIGAVETGPGEFIVEGEFESDEPSPTYEIDVLLPNRSVRSVTLDAQSGKVLHTEIEDKIDF